MPKLHPPLSGTASSDPAPTVCVCTGACACGGTEEDRVARRGISPLLRKRWCASQRPEGGPEFGIWCERSAWRCGHWQSCSAPHRPRAAVRQAHLAGPAHAWPARGRGRGKRMPPSSKLRVPSPRLGASPGRGGQNVNEYQKFMTQVAVKHF